MNAIKKFMQDEEGATAIEYGLLAALIAIAIIVGAKAVGTNLNVLFNRVALCLTTPASCV
jgi:pilus assembly protein Flp/PilA